MELQQAVDIIQAASQRLGWCGCGAPDEAAHWLKRALAAHPRWDHPDDQIPVFGADEGREYVLRYILDHAGLTEHGGTVGGAWLTEMGKQVLAALQFEGAIDAWDDDDAGPSDADVIDAILAQWRGAAQ